MNIDRSEMRGVFIAEPIYGYAHDWNAIAQTLAQSGIEAVFVQDQGGLGRRPDSEISAAIAAFHAKGIEYHSVINSLSETGAAGDPYVAITSAGTVYSPYVQCPIKVHDAFLQTLASYLNTFGVDGIMLDYIRYDTQDMCYCPQCKAAFQAWLGEGPITDWTPFYPDQSRWLEYAEWRTIPITELVRDLSSWIRANYPNVNISESAWTYFSDCPIYWRKFIGQDTGKWIKESYIDFVAPMMYTGTIYGTSGETLESFTDANLKYMVAGPEGKIPLVALLRVSDLRGALLTPSEFKAQVDYVRSRGLDGWILYMYGGPGADYPPDMNIPDITLYLSMLSMPATFTVGNIQVSAGGSQASVSWTTDLPATSKLEYSISPLFTSVFESWGDFYSWNTKHNLSTIIESGTLVTNHSVLLTGLLPKKQYYFRVQSSQIATSKMLTFTTTEAGVPHILTIESSDKYGAPITGVPFTIRKV